jgi:two-component system sensor histidine kinase KdpD
MVIAARYALAPLLVAAATLLAYACQFFGVQAQTLALVYVIPVIVEAAWSGWGPAFVAAIAGVAAFDFLFTQPLYSLQVTSPSDIAAMVLLAIVAGVVSAVAAQARRRGLDARASAERSEALRKLAHAAIHGEGEAVVFQAAADALARIFGAPSIVYSETGGLITAAASAGGAAPSQADREAAQWAISHFDPLQGETYPFDRACFDEWPATAPGGRRFALAVDFSGVEAGRPADKNELLEVVAGYLAVALGRKAAT